MNIVKSLEDKLEDKVVIFAKRAQKRGLRGEWMDPGSFEWMLLSPSGGLFC